jgi:signal transduction histidine kinase
VFVIEEINVDSFENILITSVLIIIVIICSFSIFLGFVFANRIIKPVTELANKVNRLETTETTRDISAIDGEDEINILSQAIDSYQHRVIELLAREREFSSDASHEFRTPLMGIQAAAENLQLGDANPRSVELAMRIEARCK